MVEQISPNKKMKSGYEDAEDMLQFDTKKKMFNYEEDEEAESDQNAGATVTKSQ